MKPIDSNHTMDAHQMRLCNLGYTIVQGAIKPGLLTELRARFDEVMSERGELPTAARPDTPSRDVNRVWDYQPIFEELMDLPAVFPIAQKYMHDDIQLLGAAIANLMPAHTPARVPWHRDGDYVRLTYFLDDVSAAGGPTALIPGTHREPQGPPKWLNTDDGYSRTVAGMTTVTATAGSCMVNDTRLWHSSTPNNSDYDRKVVWIVFKTASQSIVHHEHLRNSASFIERQTQPLRRRLCGCEPKHTVDSHQ
jgi:ectoine hydroxylase-related dioxygenase (phytanoyl-CoA dioxygenase family)